MTNADRMRDDQLNDLLDALVAGENTGTREIDPATTEAARRFFATDDAPAPPRDLDAQIWEDLMNQNALAGSIPLRPSLALPGLNGRKMPRPWQRGPVAKTAPHRLRRPGFVRLALAAILLISLGFGYLVFESFRADPDRPEKLPAAVAPAETPTATPFPMTDHLIIGMWQFDIEIRQPGTDLAYFDFAEDGTFVASGERGDWVAFGNWRATGERTAELFYVLQGIPAQNVFAPDYVPAENILDLGIVTLRFTLQIDASGNTVTGEGEGTRYRDDGTVDATFSGADALMIGTRMEVVPTEPTLTPTS